MQQGHRFVCSVARGGVATCLLLARGMRGVWLRSGRDRPQLVACKNRPLAPHPLPVACGGTSKIFLTFSLERFRSRMQYPLQALLRGL